MFFFSVAKNETVDSILRKQIEVIKEGFLIKENEKINYLFNEEEDEGEEQKMKKSLMFNKENFKNEEIKRKQFEYLLDKLILSSSQFVKYNIPYLLSERGYKECSLKTYLPIDYINYYYDSKILSVLNLNDNEEKLNTKTTKMTLKNDVDWSLNYEKKVKEPHQFLKIHLIKSINDEEIKVDF